MNSINRVAIVTGAARGIGYAITEALRKRGTHVVIADVDESKATDAIRSLTEAGMKCSSVTVDVSDEVSVKELIAGVFEEHGQLDVLVNNAGISIPASIEESSLEDWEHVMAVNLRSAYLCAKHAFPLMKEARWGRVINIASFAGKRATLFGNNTSYTASKAGMIGLTRALALEGAGHSITVNAVAPGIVETDLLAALEPNQRERLLSFIPLERLAKPHEVASLVSFLASDEAAYITGEVVNINGGLYMD